MMIERDFVFDHSTKGTYVFKEVVPNGAAVAIGSLYIKKSVAPVETPQRSLRVQVEFLQEEDNVVATEASARTQDLIQEGKAVPIE